MAYIEQSWEDLPATTTPISAVRLEHMEAGIDAAHTIAEAAATAAALRCLPAGDLSGSAASPVVARINGIAVTGTPTAGQVPIATSSSAATWQNAVGTGDTSTNTATSVDSEVVVFSGTGGKTLKRANLSGIPKLASGVLAAAVAGIDYSTPSATEVHTNKDLTSSTNTFPTFNQNTTGSAARINGIAVTGTPTAGQVPVATSSSTATWQTPVGGGGSGLSVVDNGDGTISITGGAVVDNGDGTITIA